MKPIIVIQDDFSNTWSAVSSMKGIIKMLDREIDIEDGTHEIEPFNIWMAAQELQTVEMCWPKGTIFVSVVDPGVGTARRACAARLKDGNIVITPDNGTLTLVARTVGIEEIREIDPVRNRSRLHEKVAVFDGRDLFAYCAGKLAAGMISFAEIGAAYDPAAIVICPEAESEPVLRCGYAEGFITHALAAFGGIRFNITNVDFTKKAGFHLGDQIHVVITHEGKNHFDGIVPFVKSFGDVAKKEPLLYAGSSLLVSMDLNQASLMAAYDLHAGLEWKVTLERAA